MQEHLLIYPTVGESFHMIVNTFSGGASRLIVSPGFLNGHIQLGFTNPGVLLQPHDHVLIYPP